MKYKYFIVEQTGDLLVNVNIVQRAKELKTAKQLRDLYKKQNPNADYFVVEVKC